MAGRPVWPSRSQILRQLGLVALIGGGVLLSRKIIALFKERLVYPRTGYVAYVKRPSKGKLVITSSCVIAVAFSIILLGRSISTFNWVPVIIGAICGFLMFYQAYQASIYRLFIEA